MKMFQKLATAIGLAGALLLGGRQRAQAQAFPNEYVQPVVYTLLSNQTLTNAQTLTLNIQTNIILEFMRPHDLAIFTTITSTNAGNLTSNAVVNFDLSIDNTNFTTTKPIVQTVALNGTNAVRAVTIVSGSSFDSCAAIQLTSVSTTSTNAAGLQITVQLAQTP